MQSDLKKLEERKATIERKMLNADAERWYELEQMLKLVQRQIEVLEITR